MNSEYIKLIVQLRDINACDTRSWYWYMCKVCKVIQCQTAITWMEI